MTECARSSCHVEAKPGCRGMCESDYRRTIRMGINGYVPAGPVRAHLSKLREHGWTWEQIAQEAGVSTWVAHRAGTGHTRRLLKDRANAILAVPVEPRGSHRGVDSTGMRRRVQALAWMGWPCAEIARRVGTGQPTLATLCLPHRRPSYALFRKVAAVYDELCMTPGPSKSAASKARRLGFAPPLAWDETTIDDPRVKARGVAA